jgi:hypothetical protein
MILTTDKIQKGAKAFRNRETTRIRARFLPLATENEEKHLNHALAAVDGELDRVEVLIADIENAAFLYGLQSRNEGWRIVARTYAFIRANTGAGNATGIDLDLPANSPETIAADLENYFGLQNKPWQLTPPQKG